MTAVAESFPPAAAGQPPVSLCIPEDTARFPPYPEAGAPTADLTGEPSRLGRACRDAPMDNPLPGFGLAEGRIGPSAPEQPVQRPTAEGFADRAARLGLAFAPSPAHALAPAFGGGDRQYRADAAPGPWP